MSSRKGSNDLKSKYKEISGYRFLLDQSYFVRVSTVVS